MILVCMLLYFGVGVACAMAMCDTAHPDASGMIALAGAFWPIVVVGGLCVRLLKPVFKWLIEC